MTEHTIPAPIFKAIQDMTAPYGGLEALIPAAPAAAPPPPPTPLLDKSAVATWLGVSQATVNRLVAAGTLPHVRLGSRVLFDRAEVEKALRKCRRSTTVHRPGRPRKVVRP